VFVHNLLLLAGIAGSGAGMFVLARRLTGETGPALAAAAVFTMGPYRLEHYMHLELQWAMWIPLTLWAVHRAVDEGSWRAGGLGGAFLALQTLSCVYYGVFLAITLAFFVPVLLLLSGRRRASRALLPLTLGVAIACVLIVPYAIPYLAASDALGPRALSEVSRYSARPISYLTSTEQNWLWGWTSTWESPERRLFPGFIAILLAVAAAWGQERRLVLLYGAVALLAMELSFGVNSFVYTRLLDHLAILQGLRAPARLAIVVLAATAVLAGFGMRALRRRIPARYPGLSRAAVPLVMALLVLDYVPVGIPLREVPPDPPPSGSVYAAMRSLGPGAVVDLPTPRTNGLPGYDILYAYWSRLHWYPLVNGYSGFYPRAYMETLSALTGFPYDRSLARLGDLGVRYVIVHRAHYRDDQFQAVTLRMLAYPGLRHVGRFTAASGDVELMLITP
jgi:hypothetical protein